MCNEMQTSGDIQPQPAECDRKTHLCNGGPRESALDIGASQHDGFSEHACCAPNDRCCHRGPHTRRRGGREFDEEYRSAVNDPGVQQRGCWSGRPKAVG